MINIINLNRNGEPIKELSAHIIKHDEHPDIWATVAQIAANKEKQNA